MITLALRMIAFRPMRYLVALLGIAVAAGLAFIQLGLYRGFKENASVVVDHTKGDIWVCATGQDNFDFPNLLSMRYVEKVREVPGVAKASPMLVVFAPWRSREGERLREGADQTVEIIGFDPHEGTGGPWSMSSGLPEDLNLSGFVTMDTTSHKKLFGADVGSVAEINGTRVEVAGLTHGIRSFQGNPMVFCNMETARSAGHMPSDAIHYIIVELVPGADVDEVLERIRTIPFIEAYTTPQFSFMAQDYWLTSTGAGTALAMAALLGLIVGVVVAGQVLYTSTLEHLKEYGTLKAIGATNTQVAIAIMAQALAWAIPAHLIAGGLLLLAMTQIEGKGIHLAVDARMYAILGGATIAICMSASMLSVIRVLSVQPSDVFKG